MTNRNRQPAANASRAYTALLSLVVGAAAAATSGIAFADEGGARRCIGLAAIEGTEIVDDGTILFRMRNGDVYRNVLRHECPTLKHRDQFSYRVSSTQLCSADLISVLEQRSFGLEPGFSCSLGSFEPVGAAAAQ